MKIPYSVPATILLLILVQLLRAQSPLVVKAAEPIAPVQPTMWGIFFEDINFAADGGLYAELVKNRSFEFAHPLMGWKEQKREGAAGSLLVLNRGGAAAANPRFVRLERQNNSGAYGLSNEGFRGMGIKAGEGYTFSVLARRPAGSQARLRIELVDAGGQPIAGADLAPESTDWQLHTVDLTALATEAKATLNLWLDGAGAIDLDMLSLFPKNTWKGRPNGLRADLVQLLADLQPGFVRFPGGCIVEGRDLANRYQWKKTVGPVEQRELMINRWNTEFRHRPAPDYFQSFGLGFFEYFQLAEDLGAEPLPILSCGIACQFNTAEVVPLDQLDPYIQDALDLIEFANSPVTSPWGRVRADMGHPAPFNLRFLGIGNEQWGPQYIERYKAFAEVLQARHPEIVLVSGTGPFPDGDYFDYAAAELKALGAEVVDEHYYRNPEWFLENAARYDSYDRNGPRIFAGEYAAQSVGIAKPENENNWRCALAEAAFMTGLERNADVVHLTSYAPLLAHAEGWQWTPDLIWFDNLRAYGTPNYYVQQLFSTNRGTHVLPLLADGAPLTGQQHLYGSAVRDEAKWEIILKLVNASDQPQSREVILEGIRKTAGEATVQLLTGKLEAINGFAEPRHISPRTSTLPVKGRRLEVALPAYSLSVIQIKVMP